MIDSYREPVDPYIQKGIGRSSGKLTRKRNEWGVQLRECNSRFTP